MDGGPTHDKQKCKQNHMLHGKTKTTQGIMLLTQSLMCDIHVVSCDTAHNAVQTEVKK